MNITSLTIFRIGFFAFCACSTGCKENKQASKETSSPQLQSLNQSVRKEPEDSQGEAVSLAAKDFTLPAEIREGAAVFELMLQNKTISLREFNRADWKLHSQRTEATCKIWISLLLATEARLPNSFPSKEEMIKFEKLISDNKIEPFEVNPMRYIQLMNPCVKALTQYDMPEADLHVEGFMKRLESKYGSSEVGRLYIDLLKIEISQAKKARESGAVPWKLRLAKEAAERK